MNELAKEVVETLIQRKQTLTVAESCTGGLIAKMITDVPGSSAIFPGSFVTYSNDCKMKFLGVPADLIEKYTEVSEECAKAMAEGARKQMNTDYALSVTGYAGPGGGTAENPVGTVYIGFASDTKLHCKKIYLPEATREQVRNEAAKTALEMIF